MRRPFIVLIALSLLLVSIPQPTSRAQTFRPVVRGKRGVVAGGHPLSVEAGLRILQQGGNAVDAGVATILAASVIEFSHFSFGGEVPILIKLKGKDVACRRRHGPGADEGHARVLCQPNNATKDQATAPDSAKAQAGGADMATMAGAKSGLIPSTGPLAATVPAVLDACVTALDQFGTKSLAEVMQPAIELADGFPIDELRVQYIQTRAPIFSQWPDAKRIFLPNGAVPKVGDIFVQADLARTLREIVAAEKRGAMKGRHDGLMAARDYFYQGPVAKRIGDYMQTHGGLLAAEDLARFHARVGSPVKADYHGYEIYKAGFWTQGPAMVEDAEPARRLRPESDGPQLGRLHSHAHRSAQARARRSRSLLRRSGLREDSDGRTAVERLRRLRRSLIENQRASLAQQPGDPSEHEGGAGQRHATNQPTLDCSRN